METKINYTVLSKHNNYSVLELLKSFYVGKSKIEELRSNKGIFINNIPAFLNSILKENDILTFVSNENEVSLFEDNDLEVIYEDADYIAVYKKEGLLIHEDGNSKSTLINRVAYYLNKKNESNVLYPVHRIDLDTKGLVVFCKNFLSSSYLSHEIETRSVQKKYLALAYNKFSKKEGIINLMLGKNRHEANKMVVLTKAKTGLNAITKYKVLNYKNNITMLECELLTGRKHQIRVSLSYLNHPLLGDKLYGIKDNYNLKLFSVYFKFNNFRTDCKLTIELPNKYLENELKMFNNH